MAHRDALVYPSRICRAFDKAMLAGVSLLALMMASDRSMARTLTTAAARLRALPYPAADAADAKALERDLTKLGSESSMMVGQTDVSLEESLGAQIMSDEANETADRAALMQDLGLRKLPRL